MKQSIFILFAIFIFSYSAIGQNKSQKAAKYAADLICDCVNTTYNGISEDIRIVLKQMMSAPKEEQLKFVQNLDQTTRLKLIEESSILNQKEKQIEFQQCREEMEQRMKTKFPLYAGKTDQDETLIQLMMVHLDKKKECQFTLFLMKLGMQNKGKQG